MAAIGLKCNIIQQDRGKYQLPLSLTKSFKRNLNKMATIKLTQNKITIIDEDDFELVNKHKWHYVKRGEYIGYAARGLRNKNGTRKVWLHSFILNAPKGLKVDHINGNSLDNRRENLRPATTQQNNQNQRKSRTNSSGYKGVYYAKLQKKYIAQIKINGKSNHIGCFDNPIEAAKAYDNVARKVCGEFAALNFPKKNEISCNRRGY